MRNVPKSGEFLVSGFCVEGLRRVNVLAPVAFKDTELFAVFYESPDYLSVGSSDFEM